MRLLHTSDWHLGAADGDRVLTEDQRYFIDAICDIVRKEAVDAVLLAGDVYDRSVPAAEAVGLYDYAMTRLCGELKVPVLIIAGNHDSAERLASCHDLLKNSGLHVLGSLEHEPVSVPLGNAEIFLLPWFTAEKVRSLYPECRDDIHSLTDAFQLVCEKTEQSFTPGKRHIALAHAFIAGAETSTSDRSAEIGTAEAVSAAVFDAFDYVALGHIHKPGAITDKVRYSGTPMPYSFGKEETQTKGVVLLDTDTMEQHEIPMPQLHLRRSLTGTVEELYSADLPEEVRNGYVRLTLTDSYAGTETVAMLRSVYPNYLEIIGKSWDDPNGGIRMSMEEFRRLEDDPMEIFRRFCRDTMTEEPSGHLEDLFRRAMAECGEEENA